MVECQLIIPDKARARDRQAGSGHLSSNFRSKKCFSMNQDSNILSELIEEGANEVIGKKAENPLGSESQSLYSKYILTLNHNNSQLGVQLSPKQK